MPTIALREVKFDDISYMVKWMNDPKVAEYTSHVWGDTTFYTELEYVRNCVDNDDILRIITLDGKPIGNICVSDKHPLHKTAHISIMIGDTVEWGKGYATEAIRQMVDFVFSSDEIDINKMKAGIMAINHGSVKAFERNGFEKEGYEVDELRYKDHYEPAVRLGLNRRGWNYRKEMHR